MVSMTNRSTEKKSLYMGAKSDWLRYRLDLLRSDPSFFLFFFEGGGAFLNMKAIFGYISQKIGLVC